MTACHVPEVWEALRATLATATWPAIAENPDGVKVWIGDLETPPPDMLAGPERVVVVSLSESADDTGPVSGGPVVMDETFRVPVLVQSATPGLTCAQQTARHFALVNVVYARILATVKAGTQPAAVTLSNWWWRVDGADHRVIPGAGVGVEGWVGQSHIRIAAKVRNT